MTYEPNLRSIGDLEGAIYFVLARFGGGESEDSLFNKAVGLVGTPSNPVHLFDYNAARARAEDRIVVRNIPIANPHPAVPGHTVSLEPRLYLN
ncbi:MAG: hypothetical protein WCV90_03995 [Candidatus Woesearchaeota archaeon]|jgi:hypothetical protein